MNKYICLPHKGSAFPFLLPRFNHEAPENVESPALKAMAVNHIFTNSNY